MPPGFPPPPGMVPGAPPFPPGMRPPFPPPPQFVPASAPQFPPPVSASPVPPLSVSPPNVPSSSNPLPPQPPIAGAPSMPQPSPSSVPIQGQLILPDAALRQTNPDLKKKTALKYEDANFSPDEKRGRSSKYYVVPSQASPVEESRGTKRARAEDLF